MGATEQDGVSRESTVEAQLKCECGERDLVVTWTDAVEVGTETEVKMACSECGSRKRTVTVLYDPEEYDLVTPYGDGDIGLRSECLGCGDEYFGPMLRPCYNCGSELYDRYLDTEGGGSA